MSTTASAPMGPDPSWTTEELLDHAEACVALSMEWLVPLGTVDPMELDPDSRLTLALVMQRMTAVTDALALRALAAVPDRRCRRPSAALIETDPEAAARVCQGGVSCDHRWEVDELSALTGLPRWLMDRRRHFAARLATDWAELMPLLAGGRTTTEHLRKLDRASLNANPEATRAAVAAAVEVISRSPQASPDAVGRSARRAAARHTTPSEAARVRKHTAAEQTGVFFDALADGIASLTLIGETHKLEAIRALVSEHVSVTRPEPGDERTKGQRQVDLLVALCLAGSGYGAAPVPGPRGWATPGPATPGPATPGWATSGSPAAGSATPGSAAPGWATSGSPAAGSATPGSAAPGWATSGPATPGSSAASWAAASRGTADTAAGWPSTGVDTRTASEPAVGVIITASIQTLLGLSNEPGTVGDTVVSAAVIREWAANPAWARRAVIDDNGLIRTISRRQRFPAHRLRLAAQTRWQRCTFPGCPMPARRAELDHAHDYAAGGDTTLDNLHPLCPRHHRLKDQPGITVRLLDNGTARWTLSSGRTVDVPATDHRVTAGPHDGATVDDWLYGPPDEEPAPYPDPLENADPEAQQTWADRLIARDPETLAA